MFSPHLAFFATGLLLAAQPEPSPKTMTKIVVRLIGSGVKPGSHAALPVTMYVAPPHYARIEDPPDARQGLQKLIVIAEPDAYSVNLIDKKGTQAIDQGGPGDLHLPVVLPFDPKHKLGKLDRLEFGDEVPFFVDAGAVKQPGPIVNAKATESYVLSVPGGAATLVVRGPNETPVTLSWHSKEGKFTYEYITDEEVPFDPALFAKPAGVTFKQIPPDTTAPAD